MKLYRIAAYDAGPEAVRVQWVGTQADMKRVQKELIENQGFAAKDVEADAVEVPTSKPELIEFLNGAYNGPPI
jgi:hypothetical protein